MKANEAKRMIREVEKYGYVRTGASGLVSDGAGWWGINFDGDGIGGRRFGNPRTIWRIEDAQEFVEKAKADYK